MTTVLTVGEPTRREDLQLWADRRLVARSSPLHGSGTFTTAPIAASVLLTQVTDGHVVATSQRATGTDGPVTELYAQERIGPDLLRAWPRFLDYRCSHLPAP